MKFKSHDFSNQWPIEETITGGETQTVSELSESVQDFNHGTSTTAELDAEITILLENWMQSKLASSTITKIKSDSSKEDSQWSQNRSECSALKDYLISGERSKCSLYDRISASLKITENGSRKTSVKRRSGRDKKINRVSRHLSFEQLEISSKSDKVINANRKITGKELKKKSNISGGRSESDRWSGRVNESNKLSRHPSFDQLEISSKHKIAPKRPKRRPSFSKKK